MPNPSSLAMEEEEEKTEAAAPVLGPVEAEIKKLKELNGELTLMNSQLISSLAILGKNFVEMQESRDRNLREKSEMLEELRGLKEIAKAATKALKAALDFETSAYPSDALTQAAAEAQGDLITLLVKHGYLDETDPRYFEQHEPVL